MNANEYIASLKRQRDEAREDLARLRESSDAGDESPERLDASSMDDLCQQLLGQSYASSANDQSGYSMGRGHWLCPKLVVDAVRIALDSFGITLDDPEPEQDEEED